MSEEDLGEITENPYHLTQAVASGEIDGESYSIGLDVGGGSIIINFKDRDQKVIYSPAELLQHAYTKLEVVRDE